VYLTQKPLSSEDSVQSTSQILVRATNGLSKEHRVAKPKDNVRPKVKLATIVDVAEADDFYAKYAEVCKKGMEGLRKRDKKKAKEKAKAKKKGKSGKSAS
jgi:signal recognition particle subunit SRP14